MVEPRFLVVRLGSLGDIVHTFPAVAALRNSFPRGEIVWLTHPRWVGLVSSSQLATEVWPVDTRDFSQVRPILRKIRHSTWDAAIDYQGLWKSAALPFLGRVPRRIGFSSASIRELGVPVLYTDRVRTLSAHIAEQNGELSVRAGASSPVGQVALSIEAQVDQRVRAEMAKNGVSRYVVLSPGGGWRSKCWPPQRFGALCQKICAELHLRCVINYGPGEEPLVSAIQQASGSANPVAYGGELPELMAALRNAVCIVGGDTGPLHLAVALGTPAVAIFGPTDPARNGPYTPRPVVLRAPSAVTSYRRGEHPDPSLLQISVEQVFAALCKQVERR